jgi:hypothetical protein
MSEKRLVLNFATRIEFSTEGSPSDEAIEIVKERFQRAVSELVGEMSLSNDLEVDFGEDTVFWEEDETTLESWQLLELE